MTTRLQLYNLALLFSGERSLASLTEAREPRRLLDQVWDTGGVKKCLEMGQWIFAMRTMQIDYDPDLDPQFGFQRAFSKPSDWCATSAVCSDEYFREPLIQYVDEAGYWYADLDTIYVRYVSDDDQYGADLNSWPGWFEDLVACFFSHRIIWKLSGSDDKVNQSEKRLEKFLKIAQNRNMQASPTKFPPAGSWSRSRIRNSRISDGGPTTGNLY